MEKNGFPIVSSILMGVIVFLSLGLRVRADIVNCYSYTYWYLTGEEKGYVKLQTLKEWLIKNHYMEFGWDPSTPLEAGDVVFFEGMHSGVVRNPGLLSSVRQQCRLQYLRKDDELFIGENPIPIKTAELDGYPEKYIRSLAMTDGASQRAIEKRLANKASNGFYRPRDTIERLCEEFPVYKTSNCTIWKQARRLVIDPKAPTEISANDSVHYLAYFVYYRSRLETSNENRTVKVEVSGLPEIRWDPEFATRGRILPGFARPGQWTVSAKALITSPAGLVAKERWEDSFILTVKAARPMDVSGLWKTSWEEMDLHQNGNWVSGTYTWKGGSIEGTLDPATGIFEGTWRQSKSPPNRNWGKCRLVFSSGSNSFEGGWMYGTTGTYTYDWTGSRTGSQKK